MFPAHPDLLLGRLLATMPAMANRLVARDKVRSRELHMADGTNGSPQRDPGAATANSAAPVAEPRCSADKRSLTRRGLGPV